MENKMKMYLVETPGDVRTWNLLPTHNIISFVPEKSSVEIEEDARGNIFIEQYTNKNTQIKFYYRVSSDNNKSVHSDWIKRFSVK
jgi:hypothetical protein